MSRGMGILTSKNCRRLLGPCGDDGRLPSLLPKGGASYWAALAAGATFIVAPAALADIMISTAQTQNMTCSGGVCTPTTVAAVLNVGDLQTMLASGNVEVTTTGSGVQANDIVIDAALDWSSTHALALDAYQSITVSKPVSVAGAGGLALTTNDGGSNGTLSFGSQGSMSFQNLSSPLTINGVAYTLENSVATLASAILANPSGAFALASNYDAAQDGTYSDCPIKTQLDGTLEGLGNTISNLSINARSGHSKNPFATFLGGVGTAGVVANLRLDRIRYDGIAVGGLAGGNDGYLFDDEVTGSINASKKSSAGGLVPSNYGTIVSSSANVRVKVACCHSDAGLAGGLVTDNAGTIELSHASGNVSGPVGAGGLADLNEGTISQSYATGTVSYGGGLVGSDGENGSISNSYATGNIKDSSSAGFVWFIAEHTTGTITDSYSTGRVASGDGGFICSEDVSNLSDNYWDTTTSGTDYSACDGFNVSGVSGLTTQQLQSGLPAGFDSSIWAENPKINGGLPYLINNPPEKK